MASVQDWRARSPGGGAFVGGGEGNGLTLLGPLDGRFVSVVADQRPGEHDVYDLADVSRAWRTNPAWLALRLHHLLTEAVTM